MGDDDVFTYDLGDGRIAHCREVVAQPYDDCQFSAGLVEGLGVDTLYVKLKRDSDSEPHIIFMRPDEMQAMAWVCNGTLWSHQILEMDKTDGR